MAPLEDDAVASAVESVTSLAGEPATVNDGDDWFSGEVTSYGNAIGFVSASEGNGSEPAVDWYSGFSMEDESEVEVEGSGKNAE